MTKARRRFLALATGIFAILGPAAADAQSYPARAIKLVVAFPAGGPADTMGRLVAQAMSSRLGQPVVVENIGGAGGTIALRTVMNAAPDGYTLMVHSGGPLCASPLIYKLDYEPVKSFTTVGTFATDSAVLVVGRSVPAKTVGEFVQHAKANPGKMYSGASTGTNQYLMSEAFKAAAGIDVRHVPYRGGGPAIADLLGGQIHMVVNNKSVLLALAQDGRLTALAVTSTARWRELPTVPTMAESGFTSVPNAILYAVFAPRNTPPAIVDRLNRAINEGMTAPEIQTTATKLGIDIKLGTPAESATAIANDCPRWIESAKLPSVKAE